MDLRSAVHAICHMASAERPEARGHGIPSEQKEPGDYLLWGCFRSGFASSSTPAGCLFQLIHGLDEGARGAKSPWKKNRR
jgi:hypothetical protein